MRGLQGREPAVDGAGVDPGVGPEGRAVDELADPPGAQGDEAAETLEIAHLDHLAQVALEYAPLVGLVPDLARQAAGERLGEATTPQRLERTGGGEAGGAQLTERAGRQLEQPHAPRQRLPSLQVVVDADPVPVESRVPDASDASAAPDWTRMHRSAFLSRPE